MVGGRFRNAMADMAETIRRAVQDPPALAVDLPAHPSGSPTYPIDVFAALSADRRKLAISVVNPTGTAQDCDLNLTGVQLPNHAARN